MDVITGTNISKHYRVYYDRSYTLKEKVLFHKRNNYKRRNVLDSISFNIKKGEVVGIIGENGCGKSTLLKVINKIIYPDSGELQITGRITGLIELGAGFHPDMNGIENIYTNASIYGLSKNETNESLESIIAFSELGDYINNPVRTYSSGMYMRLAFAIAINVNADILLIDEILAVGDSAFQMKCINKLIEMKQQGITIVIVSHDSGSIEKLCDRAIWICDGKIRKEGNVRDTIYEYLDFIMNKDTHDLSHNDDEANDKIAVKDTAPEPQEIKSEEAVSKARWGNNHIYIKDVYLTNSKKEKINKLTTGSAVKICIDYKKNKPIDEFIAGFGILRNDGVNVFGTNTFLDNIKITDKSNDEGTIIIDIPQFDLISGHYTLDIALQAVDNSPYDYFRQCLEFDVYSNIQDVGVCRVGHSWFINGKEQNERLY